MIPTQFILVINKMGAITSICTFDKKPANSSQKSPKSSKSPKRRNQSLQGSTQLSVIPKSPRLQNIAPPKIVITQPSPPLEPLYDQNGDLSPSRLTIQLILKILKNPNNKKTKWSDFIIYYLIGTGGFGEVFLGQLRQNKKNGVVQRYAIKRMKKSFVIKKRLTESIRLEKKILEESSCNFITRLYFAFKDDHYLYIVMEWAQGGDTYTFIRPSSPRIKMFKNMGETALRFILGCLILGLEYLHSKQIVYRDLKPQNLLIFSDGYVKLTDFGLARELRQNQGLNSIAGTTVYYAPQMVLGENYGRQIDLWTLGIYSYQMSNFSAPFAAADLGNQAKVQKIVKAAEKNRVWKNPILSSELKSFINSLLRFDPSSRLGSKDWQEVKNHPFFTHSKFSWKDLEQQRMSSPLASILKQFKIDYEHYDAARMNPQIKTILPQGSEEMLPSWSHQHSQ